jgi:hypothetical protein
MEAFVKKEKVRRQTAQLFDMVFKRLIHLSGPAVVNFINGLFGTNYPPDSPVEYPNVENVDRKLKRLLSDTMIIIGGIHVYHIEAQISDDENIAVRVFEYGYAEGLRTRSVMEHIITVKFPDARIIYWETTSKTPDEVVLRLEFPDDSHYDYKVKTFKPLNYTIAELKERKMAILLPFYVLKLRKRVVKAKSEEERRGLAGELKALLEDLDKMSQKSEQDGILNREDLIMVNELLNTLILELYSPYNELKGADIMVNRPKMYITELDKMFMRGQEQGQEKGIALGKAEGMAQGMEKVARNALAKGLPIATISDITGLDAETVSRLAPGA